MAFDYGVAGLFCWRGHRRPFDLDILVMHNSLETFGKRSIPPCGDCDSDGDCTMNCGPSKQSTPAYSYTGNEDGDFVIWKGEQFVANVGASALAEVGKQQIAFDADKAHAERIVNALNMLSALEAGGMVLVPMVATPAMCIAGATADGGDDPMQSAWKAMLAARPQGGTND